MTKKSFRIYDPLTPEYVVMHARYKASRGRKPSISFIGNSNPRTALLWAKAIAYFPQKFDALRLKEVAKLFRNFHNVQEVEIFGSVAREGQGKDLDLILVCDEDTADKFIDRVEIEARFTKTLLRNTYHDLGLRRSEIAEIILEQNDVGIGIFSEAREKFGPKIDLFIFPPNWKNRLEELQSRMSHSDPHFMVNIAKDARVIG